MDFTSLWRRPTLAVRRGFTLVELLVVCAIIIIITSLIVIDNNKFGGEVILENLAYDVALTIRQAQVYGISVHRFGTGSTANFAIAYGMHFSISSPTTYLLFGDEDGTGIYNPNDTSPSEIVQTTNLAQNYQIVKICAIPISPANLVCNISSLDVVFKRPEPDAYISINGVSGITNSANLQQLADIVLESPKGNLATTTITASGQIYVQ